MGLKSIRNEKMYCDTNIFIYAIEGNQAFKKEIIALFSHIEKTHSQIITSELTLAECLVKPYINDDTASIQNDEKHLKSTEDLHVIPITKDILIHSARNKALFRNKLPDAIHVATALYAKCDYFITNDLDIEMPKNLTKLILKDLISNNLLPTD